MKKYQCIKVVSAKPMSRFEAQELNLVRDIETTDGPGYFVDYGNGYQSWSPKDSFENGYVEVTDE